MSDYDSLSTYVEDAIEAAIEADMEHRGFEKVSDNRWTDKFSGTTSVERNGDSITFSNPHAGGRGGVDPEAVEESQEKVAEQLANEVFNYYPTELNAAFDPWYDIPKPTVFDDQINALSTGAVQIAQSAETGSGSGGGGGSQGNATLQGNLSNLHSTLLNMKGQAAKAFGQDWVAYLPGVLDNDHLALATLGFALETDKAMYQAARDDIAGIADKAKTAFENSGPIEPQANGWVVALTMVACVGAGLAAVTSFGISTVAFTGGLAAAGASTSETLIGAFSKRPRKEVELGGDHPTTVLQNVKDAIEDARKESEEQEQAVEDVLRDMQTTSEDPGQFDLSRPHLLNVRKAPVIISENEILVTDKDIDKIIDTWLPNIATNIEAARGGLVGSMGPWDRPSVVGIGVVGAYFAYSTLEERMQEILTDTAAEVRQAAHHLEIAKRHLGTADTRTNNQLDHHSDRLDEIIRQERLAERRERERLEDERPPFVQPPGGVPLY